MDPEATRKARTAVLPKEIELIHYANQLYWRQASPDDAARGDYYRRQDRLEEIRSELAGLTKRDFLELSQHHRSRQKGQQP